MKQEFSFNGMPNDFQRIFVYASQQVIFHNRKRVFVEELFKLYSSRKELNGCLTSMVEMGLFEPTDSEHYLFTHEMIKLAKETDKDVVRTGLMGGGSFETITANNKYSVCVEFETPLDIQTVSTVQYMEHELIITCAPGRMYQVQSFASTEDGLQNAEEAALKYLSHLAFKLASPIYVRNTYHGSSEVKGTSPGTLRKTGIYARLPNLDELDARQHKALAFYRQYLNYSFDNSPEGYYYQFLSLVKIIEGICPIRDAVKQKQVVTDTIRDCGSRLQGEACERLEALRSKISQTEYKSFEEMLWEYYRHGVSHWREDPARFLDPDTPDSILATMTRLLRIMVDDLLTFEYRISS